MTESFESMFVMMDVVLVGMGGYLFYTWYLLKYKHELKENVLQIRDFRFQQCKDKAGYTAYMAPRLLAFSVICMAAGVLGLINDCTHVMKNGYIIIALVFLAVLVWFAGVNKKCVKMFWQ